jgi:penicillin-binding protein 2
MFQRRLLFLLLAAGTLTALPAAQMARLTLAKGADLRAEAEKRLVTETWLETSRGRILDCKGRELAVDRPSLDVSVDYSVISGRWAEIHAIRDARKNSEAHGRAWMNLSQEERDEAIKAARATYDAHLRAMWSRVAKTAELSEEEIEHRKQQIKEQVEYLRAVVLAAEKRKAREELAAKGGDPKDLPASSPKITLQEERQSHVILRGLSDQLGIAFDRLKDQTTDDDEFSTAATNNLPLNPGLHVIDSTRREYPLDTMDVEIDTSVFPPPIRGGIKQVRVAGVAMHELGRMRKNLYREDLERRPRIDPATGKLDFGHYRPGDSVGHGGTEQAREDTLRGLRGLRSKHVDTGQEEVIPRQPGHDVAMTIDASLEARIQALFDPSLGLCVAHSWQHTQHKSDADRKPTDPLDLPDGTPLNGAVVVIDVKTSNILAMVSMPSYSHEQIESMPKTILNDDYNQAFLNRAVAKVYPPGSIVKPLVLCEAIKDGLYSPDERIACTGHFYPDKPNIFRCWIYKEYKTTHTALFGHNLDGADAIRASCNIFFFEMGHRLGPTGIHDLFSTYGVGVDAENGGGFNIFQQPPLPTEPAARLAEQRHRGLLYEAPGEVRSVEKATPQEAILMGIGQGPLLWTPLHAASAYAALARGGIMITPRIYEDAPQETRDLNIPPQAVAQALKGLHGSANEAYGTTHIITYPDGTKENVFTAPGVNVWAKSGTADTIPFRADLAGGQQDGRDELYDSDHSWCVCLAGTGDHPQYAIACILDYGGSGGRVAGPLANQVIYALMAEGYLR